MPGARRPRPPLGQLLALAVGVGLCLLVLAVVLVRPLIQATPAARPSPVVAFMGDSYTAGTGASTPAARFVNLVAAKEGWRARNLGRGGTGYLATGSGPGCGRPLCPDYAGMLAEVVRAKPTIVVVSGGRNDTNLDAARARDAVAAFYPALRLALPKARLIVVSPIWDASDPAPGLAPLQAEVRAAARGVHATYLDIGEPLAGHADWIVADGIHPNDRGHAAIAAAVERALR